MNTEPNQSETENAIATIRKLRSAKRRHNILDTILITLAVIAVGSAVPSIAGLFLLILFFSIVIRLMRTKRYKKEEVKAKDLEASLPPAPGLSVNQKPQNKLPAVTTEFAARYSKQLTFAWLGSILLGGASANWIFGVPMVVLSAYLAYTVVHKRQSHLMGMLEDKFGTKAKWGAAGGALLLSIVLAESLFNGSGASVTMVGNQACFTYKTFTDSADTEAHRIALKVWRVARSHPDASSICVDVEYNSDTLQDQYGNKHPKPYKMGRIVESNVRDVIKFNTEDDFGISDYQATYIVKLKSLEYGRHLK